MEERWCDLSARASDQIRPGQDKGRPSRQRAIHHSSARAPLGRPQQNHCIIAHHAKFPAVRSPARLPPRPPGHCAGGGRAAGATHAPGATKPGCRGWVLCCTVFVCVCVGCACVYVLCSAQNPAPSKARQCVLRGVITLAPCPSAIRGMDHVSGHTATQGRSSTSSVGRDRTEEREAAAAKGPTRSREAAARAHPWGWVQHGIAGCSHGPCEWQKCIAVDGSTHHRWPQTTRLPTRADMCTRPPGPCRHNRSRVPQAHCKRS